MVRLNKETYIDILDSTKKTLKTINKYQNNLFTLNQFYTGVIIAIFLNIILNSIIVLYFDLMKNNLSVGFKLILFLLCILLLLILSCIIFKKLSYIFNQQKESEKDRKKILNRIKELEYEIEIYDTPNNYD